VSARAAERRALAQYVITPDFYRGAVRPFTRAEADDLIDKIHLKRALEVGSEIRAERRGIHCAGCTDDECSGCDPEDFDSEEE
jgi:hypothetical protein